MSSSSPPGAHPPFSPYTWLPLGPIATALFLIFLASVVAGAVPPRLMEPVWQLRLMAALIDNAPLALVGLGLIHLQAYLAPEELRIEEQRDRLARLAVAAALGFLLLVPLQLQAALRLAQAAAADQSSRIASIQRDFVAMQQSIAAASSADDLQRRLQQRRGPALTPAEQALPLPMLRQRLSDGLAAARTTAIRAAKAPTAPQLWGLLTATLRTLVCALALAIGFAAAARRKGSPLPEVGAFYWTVLAPDIVNSGREEHGSVSV